jgi:hypothetical protein
MIRRALNPIMFAVLLLGFLSSAHAQQDPRTDEARRLVSGAGGLLFQIGGVDQHRTVSSALGLRGGLLFKRRFMVGLTLMASSSSAELSTSQQITSNSGYRRLSETGVWLHYSLTSGRTLQPFVGIQFGWGKASLDLGEDNVDPGTRPGGGYPTEDKVSLITPTTGVHLNISRWFRPDLVLGYRIVHGVESNTISSTYFNGLHFGINLMFGGLGE